jgi:predicted dehydrogenase
MNRKTNRRDYRKMLDECHKDLDAVLVSTPDHHHAPAAIRAINLGKATFSQKPLAHNIYECRTLAEAARPARISPITPARSPR